jgi:hypothetical protein
MEVLVSEHQLTTVLLADQVVVEVDSTILEASQRVVLAILLLLLPPKALMELTEWLVLDFLAAVVVVLVK